MNRTAKRFGNASAGVVSANAGSDPSHGKAMVPPAPRRTVRREMRRADVFVRWGILFTFLSLGIGISLVRELRTRDDGLNQWSKTITVVRQHASHAVNRRFIGKHQGAAQRVSQQLPAKV